MEVYKSSLKEYLAEEVLKEIYSKKPESEKLKEIQEINYDCTSIEDTLKTYAREFQAESNKKAAMIALNSLSEEKKQLMRLKYSEQKQMVAISLALNISVTQLVKWNQAIVTKVANFMSYRLIEEDVFCKRTVIGMIELLAKNIEFFTVLSSGYKEIRQDWLKELKRRKNNYQILLERIERLEQEGGKSSFKKIVLAKMQNPRQAVNDVAEACELNQSVASRYLKRFVNSVKMYLK